MAQRRTGVTRGKSPSQAGGFPVPADRKAVSPPRRRPLFYNRTIDKLLVLLLPATWFLYYSWRPAYQLRVDMPSQFVDVPAGASATQRAGEERLAHAYWDLARKAFRPRFTYGSALPDDPPPDFKLSLTTATAPAARTRTNVTAPEVPGSQLRYWRKLQQLWLEPYAWDENRQWSTAWFTGPLRRLYINFQDYLSNRFKAI